MICGVVAICSMILPGLSGSFVLILMGNYELIMIDAVNNMNFGVLLPVVLGAIGGLIAFSHILSYIYKRFKDQTIAVLSGFILGSLIILWPWKEAIYMKNSLGEILKKKDGELIISRYEPVMPQEFNQEVWIALILMLAGVITIWGMEWLASYKKHDHAG
jgi:putative membrane protein